MEEKIKALEEAFAEFQELHKKLTWQRRSTVGLAAIACTFCVVAGVIHVLNSRWVYLAIMVVLFWWDLAMLVKQIVLLENEKADFRKLRGQHLLFVERLKKEGNTNENAEN